MKLFWMEVKRQTTSLTFTIYTVLVLAFVLLNMWPMLARNVAELPTSTIGYDDITATDFQTLKTNGVAQLQYDYQHNTYITYPLGFAKTVTLQKADQASVGSLLAQANQAETQATFVKALEQVDRLIGGQSAYSSQNIQGFASRPMTKAEAQQDHNLILKKDRISGTFARLFADYAGIVMGILPTIVVIAYCYADRRSRALTSLQSKTTSTWRLLGSRYLASLVTLLIPIFLMGIVLTIQIALHYQGYQIDYLAFFKMTGLWLLPTLMVSSAVGFLSYALFGNFLGFVVQICWWLSTMMIGARQVAGNYGWLLIPRHNSLHNVAYYEAHLSELMFNRVSYAALAIGFICLAAVLLNLQRGGKFHAINFETIGRFRSQSQRVQH
ncbi:ABC transporter permease [Lacticaseibacillus paracasei]|uniref:ABC transporter permease n=1 Tax=Lacticaseibacillus paracasei TaxID=1597 RepID=A0AAP4N3T1_LACPA|nr:ABC transporter permease [Lacticaseibacillus paracasei]MDM7453824.1 ABC transporter permease [Lacticaseibacillus paracasei]MDM7470801.1 ABC transporter permease [Lacticaseibacillus paracasei]